MSSMAYWLPVTVGSGNAGGVGYPMPVQTAWVVATHPLAAAPMIEPPTP
jgi:hypothetical protein